LISSNWGGTFIQAWSSPDALAKCAHARKYEVEEIEGQYQTTPKIGDGPNPNQYSALWNAMIVPFLRTTIKGALWYQGENNAGDPADYTCQFPAMIADWRAKFVQQNNFPFFFVQLAPWTSDGGESIAETRYAQLTALTLPNVGFGTAVDLGDWNSTSGNIHPMDKQTVGKRLFAAAKNIAYGDTTSVWLGPITTSANATSAGPDVQVVVSFEDSTLNGGLVLLPEPVCPPINQTYCSWYHILLSDNNWYRATAEVRTIDGSTKLVLQVLNVFTGLQAVTVTYAWSAWPMCNLYNGAGVPAVPFKYDLAH